MVSGLLQNPERLRAGLDEMIERERNGLRGNPEREVQAWLDKLSETDRKRSRFQDMAAEGHITLDELGAKLRELDELRKTAEQELNDLKQRRARIADLERDKRSILEDFAGIMPAALADLRGMTAKACIRCSSSAHM